MDYRWQVNISYNNDGKFTYDSTEPDALVAVSVATKQMFKKCIWLEPKSTRITGVEITDYRFVKERHEEEGISKADGEISG